MIRYARRLYSLDTLDARFTTSSKRPFPKKPSQDELSNSSFSRSSSNAGRGVASEESKEASVTSNSLWGTSEFYVYYTVIGAAVIMMVKVAVDVSNSSHPEYPRFEHLLSPGWIAGRKVDNSDPQYAGFRDNIPYMCLLLVLHPLLRKLFLSFFPIQGSLHGSSTRINSEQNLLNVDAIEAENRLSRRVTFDVCFAALFLVALHGVSAFKVLLILYMNYTFTKRLPRSYLPAVTWIFNVGILFANELCKGYPLGSIANYILSWSGPLDLSEKDTQVNWGSVLDSYGGLVPRWEILFNFTVLRLISFNFDFYWSYSRVGESPLEKKQLDPSDLSERDRISISANSRDYSFPNYVAYCLYAPLYLTGPVLTFNDYISQLRYTPKSIATSRTMLYGIRFLISLLTMEVMIHFIYAIAISKAQPVWNVYTPFQLSMLGYFNLHHIWLKLLLPWRFFRLWALLDGVDPPENMVRCMSDNYSTFAFWRAWHRSFNRWIIRYIYIPLGGSGVPGAQGFWKKLSGVINLLPVFTFVAIWHDINLKLLVWGWLVTFFVLPEAIAEFLFPKKKWKNRPSIYRAICAVGAVGNILMLMAANLVGFAVGLDGITGLIQGIVGSYSGLVFLIMACVALYTAAQVMFEIREDEIRQGIRMKC